MVDEAAGFRLGDTISIGRNSYTVTGLTRRMLSSGGDPMAFVLLKDAQEAQFLKDSDSILRQRRRTAANPSLNRPGVPGPLDGVIASRSANPYANVVLVRLLSGADPEGSAEHMRGGCVSNSTPGRIWKKIRWGSRSPRCRRRSPCFL